MGRAVRPWSARLSHPLARSRSFRMLRTPSLALALFAVLGLVAPKGSAAFELKAQNTPNDAGQSVSLSWTSPTPPARWILLRREAGGTFAPIDTMDGGIQSHVDEGESVKNGSAYEYQLIADPPNPAMNSDVSAPATPGAEWFDTAKVNVLVVTVAFFVVLFFYIGQARRGVRWKFRTIPGLVAIEEAIGRATEMGRGILYIPGVQDIDD